MEAAEINGLGIGGVHRDVAAAARADSRHPPSQAVTKKRANTMSATSH